MTDLALHNANYTKVMRELKKPRSIRARRKGRINLTPAKLFEIMKEHNKTYVLGEENNIGFEQNLTENQAKTIEAIKEINAIK